MDLRDEFAVRIAPSILNMQMMVGMGAVQMEMQHAPNGAPQGVKFHVDQKMLNYDDIASESYLLADALVRARDMKKALIDAQAEATSERVEVDQLTGTLHAPT